MRLLIVCTANQCRSPLGEVLARRHLADRGISGTVVSAGTRAIDGSPATDGAILTARKFGLDLSAHRSRPVSDELVEWSDLVLTMEPEHTVAVVGEHGGTLSSSFTLPELAELVAETAPCPTDEPIGAWLKRIAAGRGPGEALAAAAIDDPIGRPLRHYRLAARAIDDALGLILDRVGAPHR